MIRLERGDGLRDGDIPALETEIVGACRDTLRTTSMLIWLPPLALPRHAMKTKLIEIESSQGTP